MNCKVCRKVSPRSPGLSFFRFPSDHVRCREWAERCNILPSFEKHGPVKFYKSFRICSDHFEERHVVFDGRKKKLLRGAVPIKARGRSREGHDDDGHPGDENGSKKSAECALRLLANLCRFCAEENTDLIDIYSWKGDTLDLVEKIKVFPIAVDKEDKLPLKVCNRCIVKICKFYDFVRNCLKADARLRTILGIGDGTDTLKAPHLATVRETATESTASKADEDDFDVNHERRAESSNGGQAVTESEGDKCRQSVSLVAREKANVNFLQNRHSCSVCFKSFAGAEILESHKKAHYIKPDEDGRFSCRVCNKIFPNKYRLNDHSRLHTGESPFKCPVCCKRFHKMSLLKQHSAVHESTKRFICSICNFGSNRKGNLVQHLRTHERSTKSEGPRKFIFLTAVRDSQEAIVISDDGMASVGKYICGVCRDEFDLPNDLKNHLSSHVNGLCRLCGKKVRHRDDPECRDCKRSKSKQSIHRCDECGACFKRKDTLQNHTRIHTGERPFICGTCGFAFKQKGDCVKHERNHSRRNESEAIAIEGSTSPLLVMQGF